MVEFLLGIMLAAAAPGAEPHPYADAYDVEPNDTWEAASDLQTSNQYIMRLSVWPSGDHDWYQWTASRDGSLIVNVFGPADAIRLEVYQLLPDLTLYLLGVSEDPWEGRDRVQIQASRDTVYLIHVQGVDGAIAYNYTLQTSGTAHDGTWNSSPWTTLDVVEVNEATKTDPIEPLAVDWDGDALTYREHSSVLGRVDITPDNKVTYLPGTSITKNHYFYYVADDGRGGKAKGAIKALINPLTTGAAFPEAEGAGAGAAGGRGGSVRVVTNCEDDATNPPYGSLRYWINEANGAPRIICFGVSGIIFLDRELKLKSNLTIAGETAPGKGITILGNPERTGVDEALVRIGDANEPVGNVILRYLRLRDVDRFVDDPDDPADKPGPRQDTVQVLNGHDVILDHCSLSWGNDETFECYDANHVTLQWCIVSEGLATHAMGTMATMTGTTLGYVSLHHNLWAHHTGRMPLFNNKLRTDVVNNLMYNWSDDWLTGAPRPTQIGVWSLIGKPVEQNYGDTWANVVNNYYVPGNDSGINYAEVIMAISPQDTVPNHPEKMHFVHCDGNMIALNPDVELLPTLYPNVYASSTPLPTEVDIDPKAGATDAPTAAVEVLLGAGASLVRDATDGRIVDDVMLGTGSITSSASDWEVILWYEQ